MADDLADFMSGLNTQDGGTVADTKTPEQIKQEEAKKA